FGGGESNSAPGIGVGGIEFRGFVEGGHGVVEMLLPNEILAVSDKEFDIVRGLGQQGEIEAIGSIELSGLGENVSKHAGNGRIFRMSGMEFLEKRQGIGIVLRG